MKRKFTTVTRVFGLFADVLVLSAIWHLKDDVNVSEFFFCNQVVASSLFNEVDK